MSLPSFVTLNEGGDKRDGLALALQAETQQFYEATLLWKFGSNDTNPWKMGVGSYPLPVFWWQTQAPAANVAHIAPV
jgi:hypothetical protein